MKTIDEQLNEKMEKQRKQKIRREKKRAKLISDFKEGKI